MAIHARICILISCVWLIAGSVPRQATAVDIYLLGKTDSGSTNSSSFGKIDSNTGVYTQIKSLVAGDAYAGNLAYRTSDNKLYATAGSDPKQGLYTIDTSTGDLSTRIGSVDFGGGTISSKIDGMSYRKADGQLYAYEWNYDKYGTIDPASGAGTILTNLTNGLSDYQGGKFAIHNDVLYAASNVGGTGKFLTIGFSSGSTFSQIGSGNDSYKGMVLASDGTTLFGLTTQTIYSINPTTGALTQLQTITGASVPVQFRGAAILPVPVPEPSTYALGAVMTGMIGLMMRCRRR